MKQRILIFFILGFLPSSHGMAQIELEDSTNFIISGRVIDNNQEPVEGCILSLLQVEDSTFVEHGLTGEDGNYSISFRSNKPNLLLRLSGFNIKQQIKKISVQNQCINFKAAYESITLKEVVVNTQAITWYHHKRWHYQVSRCTHQPFLYREYGRLAG